MSPSAAPDKFRGSLSAADAARAMAAGLRATGFDARELPLADGGEGTLDVLLGARGGTRRVTRVTGPLGTPVDAEWALLADGTAMIQDEAVREAASLVRRAVADVGRRLRAPAVAASLPSRP